MIQDDAGLVTELLNQAKSGHAGTGSDLIPLVYDELRRLARISMKGERSSHTLQVTGLVNEAYLRMMRPNQKLWSDRNHFFAVAASVMRRILVDHARARKAAKRGGGDVALSLDNGSRGPGARQSWDTFLELHDALDRFAALDARAARVIELRYFAGLTTDEIAGVLKVASRTVRRDLDFARAWLYTRIAEPNDGAATGV